MLNTTPTSQVGAAPWIPGAPGFQDVPPPPWVGGTDYTNLAFTDDFNTGTLNAAIWSDALPDGTRVDNANGNELQYYETANAITPSLGGYTFDADDIILTAQAATNPAYGQPLQSGLIRTSGLNFLYGCVEARILLPTSGGPGFWPKFTLHPIDGTAGIEIDPAEWFSADANNLLLSNAYLDGTGNPQVDSTNAAGVWNDGNYHIVTLQREPNSLTWYIDRVPVYQITDPGHLTAKPCDIRVSLAVRGPLDSATDPLTATDATTYPTSMSVDYVAVWTRVIAAPGVTNATYDPSTLIGQTRFHAADTAIFPDPLTPGQVIDNTVFSDAEITMCLNIQSMNDPIMAASFLLEALAADASRLAYLIGIGTLKRDKSSLSSSIAARAAQLRKLAQIGGYVDSPDQIFSTDNTNDSIIGSMTGW